MGVCRKNSKQEHHSYLLHVGDEEWQGLVKMLPKWPVKALIGYQLSLQGCRVEVQIRD